MLNKKIACQFSMRASPHFRAQANKICTLKHRERKKISMCGGILAIPVA